VNKEKNIRQPIIAVMGHVDHGKTTFLDSIRGTRVADKEAGGITQNTRAHEITRASGFRMTFIDTPGHEAFSKMRERGANVTDFVLLIVAADDGVQPQTKESIEFAKKSGVPIILAINKVDLPGINTLKIKTELSSYGVAVEEYGGETMAFEISGKNKTGLEELLDGIELLSEINELKTNEVKYGSNGEAFILESNLDKRLGNVALCILKAGNLPKTTFGVTKEGVFKSRAYLDQNQKQVELVEESQPFWITGLKELVSTGETIFFFDTEEKAKAFHEKITNEEIKEYVEAVPEDAESLFAQMLLRREEEKSGLLQKELNVVVKASTQGTLEAIIAKLSTFSTEEAKVNILLSGTGNVTEDEINRAKLAKAIVVTFQLPTPNNIAAIARQEKVLVRNYEVIYDMFDEVQEVLNSIGVPQVEEIEVARAKVKQLFTLTNGNVVLGSEVTKGTMLRGYRIWIERVIKGEKYEVGRGKISSLRVLKNEVKEVKKGLECGIILDTKIEGVEEGDEVVAYRVE
jgi:translation initiation factor IF-2